MNGVRPVIYLSATLPCNANSFITAFTRDATRRASRARHGVAFRAVRVSLALSLVAPGRKLKKSFIFLVFLCAAFFVFDNALAHRVIEGQA